jgi:hypothetical protein
MASSCVVKGLIQNDLLWEVDGDDIQALPVGINAYSEYSIEGKLDILVPCSRRHAT